MSKDQPPRVSFTITSDDGKYKALITLTRSDLLHTLKSEEKTYYLIDEIELEPDNND